METRWRNKNKRKENIDKLLKPNTVITVFDTETTGLDKEAKIIQFSAIKYNVNSDYSLNKLDEMDIFINPCEKLKDKITKITGITDKMLENAMDETYWSSIILEFLEDSDVICGYNVPFDIRMINQMAERTKKYCCDIPYLDVCEMARDWVMKSESEKHNLSSIVEYMHPDGCFQFHSAIEDVKATALLLQDFVELYKNHNDDQINKGYVHLEKASLVINPRKKSEQRIKLLLNVGEFGDIFWDVVNQEWGCCLNSRAKRIFNETNLSNLEEQFLEKYGYRFGNQSPKDVAKTWIEYKKNK